MRLHPVSILTDSWEPVQPEVPVDYQDYADVSILTDSWEPVQRASASPMLWVLGGVSILTDSWEPVQRSPGVSGRP